MSEGPGLAQRMTSNYLRVVEGLDILDNVLAPFVVRVLRQHYDKEWWSHGVLGSLQPDQRRRLPHGGSTDELIRWLDPKCREPSDFSKAGTKSFQKWEAEGVSLFLPRNFPFLKRP